MNKKKFKDLIISEYKRDFYKKSREEEIYSKIRKMLIKKGYKPLNIITYTYSFDCKETKRSNKTKFNYPYTLILKYPINTAAIPYKQAV